MDEEIRIPIALPLDVDGFLRRECPNCEREFKLFSHQEGDPDAERVSQYFCPLCGVPADVNQWNTPAQNKFMLGAAGPHLDQFVADALSQALKGIKGVQYKANQNFTLDLPDAEPLHEPDDMVIVEPPCHPNEPLKVPDDATILMHCLICGSEFSS